MNVVLGHLPEYTELADRLGAERFSVPEHVWDRLSVRQQWELNRTFLETRVIEAESQIVFSHRPQDATSGTFFKREINYLVSRGVRVAPDLPAYLP